MDIKKDIMVGTLLFTGILSFISGLFIVSSAVFGSAAVVSSLNGRTGNYK